MDTPRLVGGRYRLLRRLGSGGMGTVWEATDERLHRQVAVKQVLAPPGLSEDDRQTMTRRTLREARAAAAISSPSVVTVFDVVDDGDMPWIVMELLHAPTLSSVIAEKGPLAVADAASVGLALLGALEAAHAAGVLHRDVKPSNVMVGDRGAVVLTDFGVAILDSDASLTSSGALIGSPAYLAPERARGEPATAASDLWSLGATLYTAVEGRPPFQREGALATLAAVMTDPPLPTRLAGALAPLLLALLSKDPAGRPAPAQLRSELLAVLDPAEGTVVAGGRPATAPVVDRDALDAADRTGLVPLAASGAQTSRSRVTRALFAGAGLVCAAALVAGLLALRPAGPGADGSTDAVAGASVAATPAAGVSTAEPTSTPLEATRSGEVQSPTDPAGTQPPATQSTVAPVQPAPTQSTVAPVQPAPTQRTALAQPPVPPGPTAVAGGPAVVGAPEGYRTYTDGGGWSLAVPQGWEEVRNGPRVDFRSPDGQLLRVDSTTTPAGDPVGDWENQERSVSRRLAGYQRILIEPVEYRGWDTADWRFTFDGTRDRIKVLNRGFVVAADEAHALYYSAPEDGYDETVHQVAAATFTPAA